MKMVSTTSLADQGSDPTLRDTDGDGILDGLEDADKNGIWNPLTKQAQYGAIAMVMVFPTALRTKI